MNDLERRWVPTSFEVRAEGDKITFEGYALKWDQKSQNLGGFREKVAAGATDESIANDDIRALFNHDPNLILGRNRAGTLELSNDDTGTYYRTTMPDTSYARDLAESMQRGDVTGSSFGFRTVEDDWNLDEDDFPLRTLVRVSLFDVSPVTYPAYLSSTSGVGAQRALADFLETRGLAGVDLNDRAAVEAALRGGPEPVALHPAVVGPDYDGEGLGLRARLL